MNAHIPEYKYATYDKLSPTRTRRLLLHKKEIVKLKQKLVLKGYTAVPLKIYFTGNFAKVEIGIAQGKHTYDKRNSLKEQQQKREMGRVLKNSNYN
jgi:SsrA-binding protein